MLVHHVVKENRNVKVQVVHFILKQNEKAFYSFIFIHLLAGVPGVVRENMPLHA